MTQPPPAIDPSAPVQETNVEAIMTERVAVVNEGDTLAFAAQILLWRRIRHLPVVDVEGRLVGMLSDRDLLSLVVEGPAGSKPVREVMNTPVESVPVGTTVADASAMLVKSRIDALPVLREGKLVGIVSTSDILADRAKHGKSNGFTAADIMHTQMFVTHPSDTLASAVEKLVRWNIRHLPVVDADYRVVGILSDRDVRTAAGDPRQAMARGQRDGFLSDVTVDTIMKHKPITISKSLGLLEIGDLLLREHIGAVPVVRDDDTLLGIVSYVDVIGHLIGKKR